MWGFEGLGVLIRYCAWSVWEGGFMGEWVVVRGRLGGNIWRGGISNAF